MVVCVAALFVYRSVFYVVCVYSFLLVVFFFFKQKTAYEMRISDWSSDVCSSDLVEGVAAEVRALGRRAAVVMGDVTDEAEVGRMAGEAAAAFGRIDILVNNAAIRRQVPFTEMSYGEWREIMAVILDGAFLMCRAEIGRAHV